MTVRAADHFEVVASVKGVSGSFSFRIVAKRKDIEGPRFEPVQLPSAPVAPKIADAAPVGKPAEPPDVTPRQATPATDDRTLLASRLPGYTASAASL